MSATAKPNVSRAIIERLKVLDDLPHFPDALMKLEQILAGQQDVHIDDVSKLVAQDPRLTAGVIGVVNSAKYSPGFEIADLEAAVNRLGLVDVRMMAHAINYKSAIKTKPPFSEKEFMYHAMVSGFVAQSLAKHLHINQGEAFLCGLMHDLGIYLLATEDREKYKQVMSEANGDVDKLIRAESNVFQTSHPVMAARLLQQWKFPVSIIMGVASHHQPDKADDKFKAHAYLTYLSERAAYADGFSNGVVGSVDEDLPETFHNALEFFGLSFELYNEMIQDALEGANASGLV